MAISSDKAHQISLLQANLQTIRKLAGWTVDELGEKIGVSKQTISNLENANTKMSLTQYIAIRAVLDYEAQQHPENDVLPKAVHLLLDEETNLSKEEYSKIKQAIDAVAAAASGGADKSMVSKFFAGMVAGIGAVSTTNLIAPLGFVGGIASSLWLAALIDKKSQKKPDKKQKQEEQQPKEEKAVEQTEKPEK